MNSPCHTVPHQAKRSQAKLSKAMPHRSGPSATAINSCTNRHRKENIALVCCCRWGEVTVANMWQCMWSVVFVRSRDEWCAEIFEVCAQAEGYASEVVERWKCWRLMESSNMSKLIIGKALKAKHNRNKHIHSQHAVCNMLHATFVTYTRVWKLKHVSHNHPSIHNGRCTDWLQLRKRCSAGTEVRSIWWRIRTMTKRFGGGVDSKERGDKYMKRNLKVCYGGDDSCMRNLKTQPQWSTLNSASIFGLNATVTALSVQ